MNRYYGELPHHSYFFGCSNGGRQGMVAATRYPEYFDGVVANAPAFDLTPSIIAWNWNTRALKELADAETGGDISATFSDEELTMISTAAIDACDTADGADDNLVMAPFQCSFDPATLQCDAEGGEQCLSEMQVETLKKIQSGPTTSDGTQIYEGWSLAGIDGPTGARLWTIGQGPGPNPTSLGGMFQTNWLRYMAHTPPDTSYDWTTLDPDNVEFMMDVAPIFDASGTDYDAFKSDGGKIILTHGVADSAFSAAHLAGWFDELTEANGGAEATADFARLYFTPGMHHCSDGQGLTSYDPLAPLIDWVENGVAPTTIEASGTPPGASEPVSRPLCPYPSRTQGAEDGSFSCVTD
jgi:feruloyl esterase